MSQPIMDESPVEAISRIMVEALRSGDPEPAIQEIHRLSGELGDEIEAEQIRLFLDLSRATLEQAAGRPEKARFLQLGVLERARRPELHATAQGRAIFLARQLAVLARMALDAGEPGTAREHLEEMGSLTEELLLEESTVRGIATSAVEAWEAASGELSPGERALLTRLGTALGDPAAGEEAAAGEAARRTRKLLGSESA